MSSSAEQTWNELWKQGGFNRWPDDNLVRWASTLPKRSKVLEVGCGAGPNLRALESFGHEPWGVDISTEALEASLSLPPLSRGAMEAPVSATDLPFTDGEFDAVCDVQCFQHLEQSDLPVAYQEAARVLKRGGRFFEVFLVDGQAYFPDLDFCEFTPTPIRLAGFKFGKDSYGWLKRDYPHGYWGESRPRHYRYVMLDVVLDGAGTLTRAGKLCSGE